MNKFTACKVRDGKEVAKYLMVVNLRKIYASIQTVFCKYTFECISNSIVLYLKKDKIYILLK